MIKDEKYKKICYSIMMKNNLIPAPVFYSRE